MMHSMCACRLCVVHVHVHVAIRPSSLASTHWWPMLLALQQIPLDMQQAPDVPEGATCLGFILCSCASVIIFYAALLPEKHSAAVLQISCQHCDGVFPLWQQNFSNLQPRAR